MSNRNYYHTLVPSKIKRRKYVPGYEAIEESLIAILINFIEKECENGNKISYVEKPKDTPSISPTSYACHAISLDDEDNTCIEEYRGLKYGHACVSDHFIILVDLYFWFKFEEERWFKDVEEDFRKFTEVPDGEEFFHHGQSDENGLKKVIFNENRKYPDYKRKYEYDGIPEDYKEAVRQEKFKELIDVYRAMWS